MGTGLALWDAYAYIGAVSGIVNHIKFYKLYCEITSLFFAEYILKVVLFSHFLVFFFRGDRLLIIGVHIAMSHSPEDQRSRHENQTHHQRFGNNFLECDSQYSYNGCYYRRNSKWKN